MTRRRIHPRHVTATVDVATATDTGDGVTVTTADPVTVPCQAEPTTKLVATEDGPLVTSVLTLRVPPLEDADEVALFAPHSPVTDSRGDTSWVLSVAPVIRAGALVYTQVVTGERAARFGGAWPIEATITPSPGRDRWGDPLPTGTPRTVSGWIKPGTTSDPVDFDQTSTSTATLYLPATDPVASTDTVTISDSPLAGRWAVDGAPYPDDLALAVPLRRTA